jgi:hypothetical protein
MNEFVIEVKKSKQTKSARWFDLCKLSVLTDRSNGYGYRIGYFIELPDEIPKNQKFRIVFQKNDDLKKLNASNVFIVRLISNSDSNKMLMNKTIEG